MVKADGNEPLKRKEGTDCNLAIEFEREVSLGHFVRMYTFRMKLINACEWSYGHEESEWSLMTSLIRLFCCP